MGIFDKIKEKLSNEFIDIIEWLDDTDDTICHRFERYQNEIKNGAQLIVREGQTAVFINEGNWPMSSSPHLHPQYPKPAYPGHFEGMEIRFQQSV